MPVVNAYKYLGIFFSTKLSFSFACRDLACKAKKGLLCIMHRLRSYNNYSVDVFFKLFDAQIQSVLQYGSEIWGLDKAALYCEKVHLFAMKKFVFVESRTPNDLVYNELNRYPLTINFMVNCIRYWLKVLQMSNNRIPKKAYLLLFNLDAAGKTNWATKVRLCLFQYGFGFVWNQQGVADVKQFLAILKQRMIDNKWQDCHYHLHNSDRFVVYRTFCDSQHLVPLYFNLDLDVHIRYVMTRFRFGISDLVTHTNRYKRNNSTMCPLCNEGVENEIHFVLCCPFLTSLREIYIPAKYYKFPCAFRLALLLSSKQERIVRNLGTFVYKALKIRKIALS
jgi:hypothetical protein